VSAPASRKHSSLGKKEEEAIAARIEEALERYYDVESLFPAEDKEFTFTRQVSTLEEAETAADDLREAWGLGAWPIENLTEVFEEQGLKIILIEGMDGFDACTFEANGSPVIALRQDGIPGDRRLKAGDMLNIDITVIKDGFHGDTSKIFFVGEPSVIAKRLAGITYDCMKTGIQMVSPGLQLGDIGHAIQKHAEAHNYSVVREYCGHGIGREFHEDPQVLHYGRPGTGMTLEEGMTFTIEPMINVGKRHTKILKDGWTVVTKDHSLSAQWEHTILVTASGYDVLTLREGETI
jgi:methionine aminopeptidase type I